MSLHRKLMCLAVPLMLCFLALYVLSFILAIRYSVLESAFSPRFVGLENYQTVLTNAYFQLAVQNTLLFLSVGVPCLVLLSLALALSLNSLGDRFRLLRAAFILPMLIPSAAVIPIFAGLFIQDGGLMQRGLNAIGVSSATIKRLPVLLLYLWKNCGMNLILLLSALSAVPVSPLKAAKIDGARGSVVFRKILLPQIMPTVYFVTVFSIVKGLGIFREVYLLYGAYPDPSVYLLQHYMNNHFAKLNYQYLSTGATVFAFLLIIVTNLLYRYERRSGGFA